MDRTLDHFLGQIKSWAAYASELAHLSWVIKSGLAIPRHDDRHDIPEN
jgi:hypothetical protein